MGVSCHFCLFDGDGSFVAGSAMSDTHLNIARVDEVVGQLNHDLRQPLETRYNSDVFDRQIMNPAACKFCLNGVWFKSCARSGLGYFPA